MDPRIEIALEKKLVGRALEMSMADNKTGLLWKRFAPRIKEIGQRTSKDRISMQVYPKDYFKEFSPHKKFIKWACVPVKDFGQLPDGMQPFVLKKGGYAVFDYKGSSADTSIFQYIYSEWLPSSPYEIDHRPHFEVLGENYKNNDPNSEEEIWIPIKERN